MSKKDLNGLYEKETPTPKPIEVPLSGSLDDILHRQLCALERVTRQLVTRSSSGTMTKDEIQSLATCIKITLELKSVEGDILEGMTDEELEKEAAK